MKEQYLTGNINAMTSDKPQTSLELLVQNTADHNYTIKNLIELSTKILDKLNPIGTVKTVDPGLPVPDGLLARLEDANTHIDNSLKTLYSVLDKISQHI